MSKFTSTVAGLTRFVLRVFGFLQWLSGIVIGAFSVYVMMQELDELEPSSFEGVSDGAADMFDSAPEMLDGVLEMLDGVLEMFGSVIASFAIMDSTRTWLLFSILLVLSGTYCHLLARPKPESTS